MGTNSFGNKSLGFRCPQFMGVMALGPFPVAKTQVCI